MKFILVPVLMALVLTQTFSKWLVVMEYSLNKDFVAQKLCVNKAKPKLHCNGKCQMMKKLAEEEKQNSSNSTNNTSQIKIADIVLSNETTAPAAPLLSFTTISYNEEPPVLLQNAPTFSIFHPPAFA